MPSGSRTCQSSSERRSSPASSSSWPTWSSTSSTPTSIPGSGSRDPAGAAAVPDSRRNQRVTLILDQGSQGPRQVPTSFLDVRDLVIHFPTDDGIVKAVDGLTFSL